MRHGSGTILALVVALAPASALAVPAAAVTAPVIRVSTATAGHGGRWLTSARRSEQRPAQATHRPGGSSSGALEARRDDGRGRRIPTFRGSLASSRRDSWRRGRLPLVFTETRRLVPASVFHEAHAPPALILAVAGRRS
jgi:hypothetical protein